MLVSKFMPKNERKQFLSKNQEQQNNFQQNMPQPPYQMLYTIPPRPMPNRFYKNNNYNYNYRRPKYPHQQQMANKASLNQEMDNLNLNDNSNNANNNSSVTDEPDYEKLKSFKTEDEQKDYLGEFLFEFLFKKIEQHPVAQSKNLDVDTISRITGMILGIQNINEIFNITINNELIASRIKEALELLEKSKQ